MGLLFGRVDLGSYKPAPVLVSESCDYSLSGCRDPLRAVLYPQVKMNSRPYMSSPFTADPAGLDGAPLFSVALSIIFKKLIFIDENSG